MRKLYFLFFLLNVLNSAYSQTNVSGGIYQNTNWTLAGSPYVVNSSIVVFPGNTLNIEPGVEIRINNLTNNNIYIETRGTLNCIGTDLLPIKIATMYDTTNVGWQGFVCTSLQGGILNADRFHIANAFKPFAYETPLNNYQYTNCKFSHCNEAVTVANSVELLNCQFRNNEVAVYGWSYFTLNQCFFKDNTTCVFAYSTSFSMTNTNFIDNQIGVSFASGIFDTMQITQCQFINNGVGINYPNNGIVENCLFSNNNFGVKLAYDCEIANNDFMNNDIALEASVHADIHNNQINNNTNGLLISGVANAQESPLIYNNELCGNLIYNVNNNTNVNYSLLSNCFCEIDSAQIEALLIDGYDDITKGLINYQIYDSSCTVLLGTVLKYDAPANLTEEFIDIHFMNPIDEAFQFFTTVEIVTIAVKDLNGKCFDFTSKELNRFDLSTLPSGFYTLTRYNGQACSSHFIKR